MQQRVYGTLSLPSFNMLLLLFYPMIFRVQARLKYIIFSFSHVYWSLPLVSFSLDLPSFFFVRTTSDASESGAGAVVADEYPQLQEHFTKNDVGLSDAPGPIAEAFLTDFPNGEFYSMETSPENKWCGLHVIRNSMLAYV